MCRWEHAKHTQTCHESSCGVIHAMISYTLHLNAPWMGQTDMIIVISPCFFYVSLPLCTNKDKILGPILERTKFWRLE